MEVAKTVKQELQKSTVNNSTQHLLISIEAGNKFEININIQNFKEGALIKFDSLLSIPFKDRLPGLIDQLGSEKIHGILIVMLTDFCNYYNVVRPMSAEQIVGCAFDILDTSKEDYLSIEDLTIFFQGAKNGKYGKVYDRLDQQIIFDMMEVYRQERHEKYTKIKEEKESNFKSMGDKFRSADDAKEIKDLFHQANVDYYKKTHTDENRV